VMDKRRVFHRMLVILSIPMIALACIACKPKGAKDGEKTITLWHIMNYSGPKEVLAAAVERFEKAHPGVKVKVQTFSNDAYKTKLSLEMASGRVPDVFFTWGGGTLADYAKNNRVRDLTDDLAKDGFGDRFLKSPLSICSSGGRTYAVPLDLSCVPVWYNTEIFKTHDLQPPTTFAEFVKTCEVLRSKGITPIALGNKKQWPGSFYFAYLSNRIGGTETFLKAVSRQSLKMAPSLRTAHSLMLEPNCKAWWMPKPSPLASTALMWAMHGPSL
jgi:raffinose/stachyose/melibiose transport system substrate-binding protein